jgi:hypothetical protein
MKERIKQWIRYQAIKHWFAKYERLLMPATLLGGVIFDSFTFAAIDVHAAFVLIGFYFVLAGTLIAYLQRYDAGLVKKTANFFRYVRIVAPFVIQFAFGAMLSATFIFYVFSGSLVVSWPFIVPVVLLMIGNEILRHYHHSRPMVQLAVYYFLSFTLASIIIPFVFHAMGWVVFIICSFMSLIVMGAYTFFLYRVAPHTREWRHRLWIIMLVICAIMNGLYVINIIPPVPLSIRDSEVAHRVVRTGHGYELTVEPQSWWQGLAGRSVVHIRAGERIYVFSAIFAPEHLDTTIVHHWQYYNVSTKTWEDRARLTYSMIGGNTTGYRGYSYWSAATPGRWRVDIETERGQVIGRVNFDVVTVSTPVGTEVQIH